MRMTSPLLDYMSSNCRQKEELPSENLFRRWLLSAVLPWFWRGAKWEALDVADRHNVFTNLNRPLPSIDREYIVVAPLTSGHWAHRGLWTAVTTVGWSRAKGESGRTYAGRQSGLSESYFKYWENEDHDSTTMANSITGDPCWTARRPSSDQLR